MGQSTAERKRTIARSKGRAVLATVQYHTPKPDDPTIGTFSQLSEGWDFVVVDFHTTRTTPPLQSTDSLLLEDVRRSRRPPPFEEDGGNQPVEYPTHPFVPMIQKFGHRPSSQSPKFHPLHTTGSFRSSCGSSYDSPRERRATVPSFFHSGRKKTTQGV